MWWMLAGILAMFFIERFFCYHHHDVPDDDGDDHALDHAGCDHDHARRPPITTSPGAAPRSACSCTACSTASPWRPACANGHGDTRLAGFGTFLVIFLHKPFDSMTIGMLMARGGWSLAWRHTVNGLFSLAIPLGVLVFYFGLMPAAGGNGDVEQSRSPPTPWPSPPARSCASRRATCLPELQFHQHDRVKLSAALVLGLAVAIARRRIGGSDHGSHVHPHADTPANREPTNRSSRQALGPRSAPCTAQRETFPALPNRRERRFRRVGTSQRPNG